MISPAAQSFSQMTPFDPNLQEYTSPSQEKIKGKQSRARENNLGQGKATKGKGKQPRARQTQQAIKDENEVSRIYSNTLIIFSLSQL